MVIERKFLSQYMLYWLISEMRSFLTSKPYGFEHADRFVQVFKSMVKKKQSILDDWEMLNTYYYGYRNINILALRRKLELIVEGNPLESMHSRDWLALPFQSV